MEPAKEELLWSTWTACWINLPGRCTTSNYSRKQSVEHDEETSLFARYYNTLAVEERLSSIGLQWRAFRQWLQPLVSSWTAWYLEPTPICSSSHVKSKTLSNFSFSFLTYRIVCILMEVLKISLSPLPLVYK